jgi:hypothetical protein
MQKNLLYVDMGLNSLHALVPIVIFRAHIARSCIYLGHE